jgi:hypothetical protein
MPNWARQRRPWDIAPGDWRYFLRGGIAILLVAAVVTAVARWVIGRPLNEMVFIVALLVTTVLVGIQWFGTVHVTRAINRMSLTMPVARRRLSPFTIVTGTVIVALLLLVCLTGLVVSGDGPDAAALVRGGAVALLPALIGTGLLALFGRRTLAILKRPEVVQMLVADKAVVDAYRQHDEREPAG